MTFDFVFLIPFDFSLLIFFNRRNSIELMFRDLTNERKVQSIFLLQSKAIHLACDDCYNTGNLNR